MLKYPFDAIYSDVVPQILQVFISKMIFNIYSALFVLLGANAVLATPTDINARMNSTSLSNIVIGFSSN